MYHEHDLCRSPICLHRKSVRCHQDPLVHKATSSSCLHSSLQFCTCYICRGLLQSHCRQHVHPHPGPALFVNLGSPFNNTPDGILLYTVGSTSFATSFAQLMNTFWIAGIGLSAIPGGLTDNANLHNGTNTLTMVATVSTSREILVCRRFWLAMLFVATSSMFIAGVFGLVLEFTRCAPDLAMNISSLTRDNPYIHLPPGGSTLDSIERSRLM